MNDTSHRVMINGTEGNPDYLVVARSKGYVLGFKPLIHMNKDGGAFGCRLRMQAAPSDIPPAHTEAQLKHMLEVFPDIPWQKRSGTRFSTVLSRRIPWGIEFAEKALQTVQAGIAEMFDDIDKAMGEVTYLNREDAEAFALDAYSSALDAMKGSYYAHMAKHSTTSLDTNEDGATVFNFPGASADEDSQDV